MTVEEGNLDREAHPERVDRPGPFQQQAPPSREPVAPDESARALSAGLGHLGDETRHPGFHDQRHRSHAGTLAGRSDIVGRGPWARACPPRDDPWGGQDSNPRHEG